MSRSMKVVAGNWELDVEKSGGRYVVRLPNGYALSLGATKSCYEEIIRSVAAGERDDWIEKHCEGGRQRDKKTDKTQLLQKAAPMLLEVADKALRYLWTLPPAYSDIEAVPRACLMSDLRAAIHAATGELPSKASQ